MTKDPAKMTDDELLHELFDGKVPVLTVEMEERAELWSRDNLAERIAAACAATDRTAKAMAEATRDLLIADFGEGEVVFRTPNDPRCYFENGNSYVVACECGPFEWGYHASMAIGTATGKLVEPYYSFDCCFYPGED